MKLNEIAYYILEPIKSFKLVDDEEIDLRIVKQWIKNKRVEFIKNKANQGQDINLNNAQVITGDLELIQTTAGTASERNFICGSSHDTTMYRSTTELPSIVNGHSGPVILELTSEDKMQYPFSVVPYSQLRFSGSGRFGASMIFGSVDVDKYLYLKTNAELTARPTYTIKAVFEDPTLVPDFDEEADEFPVSLDMIEMIKKSVFDIDFRQLLSAIKLEDDENSANDEV